MYTKKNKVKKKCPIGKKRNYKTGKCVKKPSYKNTLKRKKKKSKTLGLKKKKSKTLGLKKKKSKTLGLKKKKSKQKHENDKSINTKYLIEKI